MRIDRSETWLAIHGYLIAFLWEMHQMPFYRMDDLTTWEVTVRCSLASFGDAGIMVTAYFVASLIVRDRYWMHNRRCRPLLLYLLTGLVLTIAIEIVAVRVPWGWDYSDLMPKIWGVGLVPLLMWMTVPLFSLALAARSTRPTNFA